MSTRLMHTPVQRNAATIAIRRLEEIKQWRWERYDELVLKSIGRKPVEQVVHIVV